MSGYSENEWAAIRGQGNEDGVIHAVTGGIFWFLALMFGVFTDEATFFKKLLALIVCVVVGYLIGFVKGFNKATTLIDEQRIRNSARQ